MKRKILFFLASLMVCSVAQLHAAMTVTDLTCEYREDPVGIDTPKPRLGWKIESDKRGYMQSAYQIVVSNSIRGLLSSKCSHWSSGKVSSDESIQIEYDGKAPKSGERLFWRVRVWDSKGKVSKWSDVAYWEMGLLDNADWSEAEWITVAEAGEGEKSIPSQYYRKEFSVAKKIAKARVYTTSLGTYQLFINGEKVSDDLFAPGWTSYHKRLQYQCYDVTDMLSTKNAIGAMVGDGWFRGKMGWLGDRSYYGDQLAFIAKLVIEYRDGSTETITTNDSWNYNYGPIEMSDWYDGETYDARKELTGWNTSNYDASEWRKVAKMDYPKDHFVATTVELPQAIEELKPIKMFTTPEGDMVADFGQNFVGRVKITHQGKRGDVIKLSFAEVLDKDGNFYNENYRTAHNIDTYILKGGEPETFEPHFVFHGFRYLRIEGVDKMPSADDIRGVVIHTPMNKCGEFKTSDDLINQLQSNIVWSQRDNFLDVPTDCPQRDERLGWTGDAQVFSPTAMFNYDVANFYTKWLRDLAVDQREDGAVPHVIPNILPRAGAAAWADAALIIPWNMYKHYGDKRILEEQYESMAGWVEYMERKSGDSYHWTGDFHYGDWLSNPAAYTDKDLIANAYFYYSTTLMIKTAKVLNRPAEIKRWTTLAENVKRSFNDYYVTPKGRIMSNTQTAYLMALTFGLLPDDVVDNAKRYLAKDVASFKHLTTGFVGTPFLCNILSEIDRDDLAFMLLMRKDFPSWLYPVTMGATTIWERWDAILPDGNFNGGSMNSFNHYSYGAIGEWMYSHITGIKGIEESPAYKNFILAPHVGGGITSAEASLESMYGEIESEWSIADGVFTYNFTIPANTTAKVILPKAKVSEVTINADVKSSQEGSDVTFTLGSGSYTASYPFMN